MVADGSYLSMPGRMMPGRRTLPDHAEEPEGDDLSSILNGLYREQMQQDDAEILNLVRQLGGNGDRYLRERKTAVRHLVSEIYSPPRVTAAAKLLPELRCIPGFAMDLGG